MNRSATLRYLFALTQYGTIGFFMHFVTYSSAFVVLCRGVFGSLFILAVLLGRKQSFDMEAIGRNLLTLFISGAALGFNWVFLFAGYRHGIAISSLCNYMAPIAVVIITAVVYKEKINWKQVLCIIMAVMGMFLLIGIFGNNEAIDERCVIYGSLAALGFVILVLCNRRLKDIRSLEKTLVQLASSVLVVLPYVLMQGSLPRAFDLTSTIIVLVLGILHTGVAYICYFSSIDVLPAQTIAILGYLEPVLNVVIGAIVFNEKIGLSGVVGAIMIIAASLGNEIFAQE